MYGSRCDVMVDSLRSEMPARCHFTEPEGGLFLWVGLPHGLRDDDVFNAGLARKVAVVPGSSFFVGEPVHSHLRLNFSNQQPEAIRRGVRELGTAVRKLLASRAGVEAQA